MCVHLLSFVCLRQWCIGNIEASQALAPGSTPGWRIPFGMSSTFLSHGREGNDALLCFILRQVDLYLIVSIHEELTGGVAQVVERLLCMQEAQGSIPCSSTIFFCCRQERHLLICCGALAQW